MLSRLVRLYEQQLSNAVQLDAARTRRAELTREAETWTRFAELPPYSILLTDRLREELQAERQKLSQGDATADDAQPAHRRKPRGAHAGGGKHPATQRAA